MKNAILRDCDFIKLLSDVLNYREQLDLAVEYAENPPENCLPYEEEYLLMEHRLNSEEYIHDMEGELEIAKSKLIEALEDNLY